MKVASCFPCFLVNEVGRKKWEKMYENRFALVRSQKKTEMLGNANRVSFVSFRWQKDSPGSGEYD